MRIGIASTLALFVLPLLAWSASPPEGHGRLSLTLKLRDGSCLIGETDLDAMRVANDSIGTVNILLTRIATVTFGDGQADSLLILQTGDQLRGKVQLASLTLITCFGKATIPRATMKELTVSHTPASLGGLSDGLVLYYSFDADHGETVPDGSGHGHDGQRVGAMVVADGIAGHACEFDGNGDYIRVPNRADLNSPKFTASAWVFCRKESAVPEAGIMGKHRAFDNTSFFVLRQAGGQITAEVKGRTLDDSFDGQTGRIPLIRQWCMVTLTYDGQVMRFFLNGEMVSEGEVAGYRGNEHDLIIGAMELSADGQNPDRFWKGLISEVRLYSRALSETEVRALYDAVGPKAHPPNP